jgi:hypothetical protein
VPDRYRFAMEELAFGCKLMGVRSASNLGGRCFQALTLGLDGVLASRRSTPTGVLQEPSMSMSTPNGPTNGAGSPQTFPCLLERLASSSHDFLRKRGDPRIEEEWVELGIGENLRRITSKPGTSK